MEKIKLLIVDDHQMVRLGLSSFMNIQPDIEVVGESADGESGFLKTEMLDPDVILMDLVMDRLDGIGATQKILAKNPERKILILTSFIDDEKVFPALAAGAKGYILKTSQAAEIARQSEKLPMAKTFCLTRSKKKLPNKSIASMNSMMTYLKEN